MLFMTLTHHVSVPLSLTFHFDEWDNWCGALNFILIRHTNGSMNIAVPLKCSIAGKM